MEKENSENISSEDFQMLEQVLYKLRSKHKLYPVHPKQQQFYKLSFFKERFSTTKVLEILLDDEPMDSPFKCVLAAGLCGWVIDPTENIFAENLMYLETERILGEYIAIADEYDFENQETKEIFGRHILIGDNFHKDIRFPLAGPNPYEYFLSALDLEEALLGELKSINSINYCLLLLHTMWDIYDDDKHKRPSWNIVRRYAAGNSIKPAPDAIEIIFQSQYAETRLRESWAKYMPSFSMLYTANYININKNHTLLEMILSTKLNTRVLLEKLPEWLSLSSYYYTNYLKPMRGTAQSSVGDWFIKKTISKTPFRAKKMNSIEKIEFQLFKNK